MLKTNTFRTNSCFALSKSVELSLKNESYLYNIERQTWAFDHLNQAWPKASWVWVRLGLA